MAVRTLIERSGVKWIDGLIASVRPVLAYGFIMLYGVVNAAQFWLLTRGVAPLPWLASATSIVGAIVALWIQDDAAILAAIVSFYFGGRSLEKARKAW